jgi:outer membrane immunogenic protein
MKKTSSALALLAALVAAGAASAADLPSRKEAPVYVPPPPPIFSWNGLYVGLNLGGGWLTGNSNNLGWGWTGSNSNSGGVVGGGQIGYNFQFGSMFVAGVETDFQGTSIGSGGGGNNWGLGLGNGFANGSSASLNWFGTVRGRIGITLFNPQLLIYGTGGFAYGEVTGNGLTQWNTVGTGWTAGGGIEYAFMPNWSAKIEYLYTNLAGNNGNNSNWLGVGWNGGNNWRTNTKFNTVRVGVNYHLNLFNTPAPVLAKY